MKNGIFTTVGKSLCLLVWLIISTGGMAQQKLPSPVNKNQLVEALKETQNTISFIENKGQWDPAVKIAGNTNIGSMYVVNDHLHFVSFEKEKHEEHEGGENHEETEEDEEREAEEWANRDAHGWGIYMDGSNSNYTITKEKDLGTKYNYLIGESYHGTDASSFGEMTLNNLYNGIDLRIYSQEEHVMEFDWLVSPGADFNSIKMRFKGQDGLSIDENGNLSVKLEFDAVKFDIPEAYQIINGKKVLVKMAFQVDGNTATFKALSKIDNHYPLVIDPSVKWGTWFDGGLGTFDEYLFAVDVDNLGNVYCGGNINITLTSGAGGYVNPVTLFGLTSAYGGSVDGILYKFNPNGTALLAITYFGTSANDRLYGMALSPDYSRLFFCGLTAGTLPVGSTAAFDAIRGTTSTPSSTDGFVGVLNSSNLNTLHYTTYLGGDGTDEMVTIRPLSNNSFVVGGTVGNAVPASYIGSAYDPDYSGSTEMYLAKFTTFSTRVFGTYMGGTGTEQLNDIQIFTDGDIAFSGSSGDPGSFPALINQAANGVGSTTGGLDGVLGVLNSNGGAGVAGMRTLSRFGGTGNDEFFGLTIGPFDTLFVTGFTSSSNFYLGPNSAGNRFRTVNTGGQDALLGKFPRNGWNGGATDPWAATYFGGTGNDLGNTLRTYTPYAVMVFGETSSNSTTVANKFPVQNLADGGSFYDDTHNGGTWDIFYFVLGTDLKTQYFGTYIGGTGNDYLGQTGVPHGSNHFVVEGDSLICLGTTVHSSSLTPNPITAGSFDPSNSTGTDDIHLIFKWRIGILLNFDYADAPASYGTPNHIVFNALKIGANIDKEDFAQPSYKAYADDSLGTTPDDEDGILGSGSPYNTIVRVQDTSTRFTQVVNVTNTTGTTAILCGWIDFNRDGDFLDANEVDTVLVPSAATSATLRWTGYNVGGSPFFNLTNDTTYMRLRLTTQSSFFVTNPSPTLSASNGEVEDYMVLRYHCVNLSTATIDTNSTSGCGTATGSIVITNDTLIAGVQYGVYYSRNGGPLQGPFYYTTTGSGNISGTLTISGLIAGVYTAVQVFHPTDPTCGFTLPGSYVILDPNVPSAPTIVSVVPNPVCTGNSFTITASGAVGATFTWRGPGGFTFTGNPLTRSGVTLAMAGQYSVKQTLNLCTSDSTITTVTVVQTPTIVSLAGTPLTSCNSSTGTITVNGLTSGTAYTINFTRDPSIAQSFSGTANGSGQIIITGLPAGTYRNFTATTTIGSCTSPNFVGPVTITNPSPPGQPTVTVTPSNLCVGQQFTLTATGAFGATFAWSGPNGFIGVGSPLIVTNAQTTNTGSYTVVQTVTQCPSIPSAGVNVTVNPNPSISGTSSTPPTTCLGTQGTITLSGLTAGVTYLVSFTRLPSTPQSATIVANGSGNVVITGLAAGSYGSFSVQVQSTLCSSNTIAGPITLNDPNTPAAPSVSSNSPLCSGNTLTLFANGTGTSYNWTSNVGFSSAQQNPTRPSSTTSMSGQYCATTTSNLCTSPPACINVTINQTPVITSTVGTSPTTCSGVNGSILISGLTAGVSYNVDYTKTPGGLQGAGPLTANGSGQITITGLSAGLYTNFIVEVASTLCSSSTFPGNVTLSDPTTPAAPTVGSNSPVCSGNSINLTASGPGTSFSWTGPGFASNQQNPSIANATPAMTGSYCATQTVANCTSPQACTSVTVNQTPSISGTASTNPTTCLGAQGTITLSGLDFNTIYTLNYDKNSIAQGPISDTTNAGGQIIITGLTAGTYANFRVTLLGCTSPTIAGPITLTDPTTPATPTAGSNSPVCSGGTINLTATGTGTGFAWTGPSFTSLIQNPSIVGATTAMTGNYCVTQTIAACTSLPGCVSVTVNPTPTIAFNSSVDPSTCGGSNGSITLGGLSANTTYLVNYIKTPPGTAQGPVPITSNGSGQIVITGLTQGSYTSFTATLTGCTSSTLSGPITLSDPATPSAPAVTGSTPVCPGNTITLTATGEVGASYSWTGPSFNSTTQNPTILNATTAMSGSYCATQTVAACVSAPACTTVVVNPTPTFAIGGSSNPTTCLGSQGTITLSGVNAGQNYTVTYLKGATPQAASLTANGLGQLVINGLTSGSYSNFVITLVSTGCPSSVVAGPVTLTDPTPPSTPSATNNGPLCVGQNLQLTTPTVAGATYAWTGPNSFTSATQNPTITGITTAGAGTYNLVVTVSNCPSSPGTTTLVVDNCSPIAVRDVYANCSGTTITGNILANDIDPSGFGIQVTVPFICGPFSGSVIVNAGGGFTFTPPVAFNGVDSICYKVCNISFPTFCDTGIAVFDYTCVNLPPVAVNDLYNMFEDDTLVSNVTGNDYDPDGAVLNVNTTPTCGPSHGTVTLATDGSFTYIPFANYNGLDTFCYQVCDTGTPVKCADALVIINVIQVNDPPVVNDTLVTTPEDNPIVICLPISDVELSTQSHNVILCGNPVNGSITTGPSVNNPLIPRNVCLTYTPATNFNGSDSICLIICDNGSPALCDTAKIGITVTPVNDPPVAVNDNYTTNEDVSIVTSSVTGVRNNDNDNADGNAVTTLTVTTTPIIPPAHTTTFTLNSDGSFTYIPVASYCGTDSFQYSVCDAGTPLPSLCDTATTYITITCQNDPPVVVDTPITTCEDCGPIQICIPITDPETVTQQHTVSFCDVPDNGIVTSGPIVNNGTNPHTVCITYNPNTNFNGLDSICLTVCDNGIPALCDNTIIRITVTPVNDPPVAVNNSYTTTENTNVVTNSSTGVRPNDNDNADGNPVTSLTVNTTPVIPPVNGTVTLNGDGSFTYVPNPNYNGLDSFQYQICDAGTPLPSLCDTATVYITITNINYPPDIPDTTVTTCEDCPINVCIPYTDQDTTDTHTATLLCPPTNGTISGLTVNQTTNEICFTYTGYANLHGLDSLCLVVCDNGNPSLCDTTTVVIVVTPVNDPPYADTIYVVTYESTPVGVNVSAATGDLEGDPLSYTYGGVIPNSGTYGITGNGAIVFVPNPGFTGTVVIPYTVCDLSPYPVNILCDGAAIVVTVLPAGDTINNHSPIASNDYVTTPINTPIVVNELANDYDPDGDPLSVTVTGPPSNGTYTVNPNGTINYTPNTGFFGSDTIDYVICDPVGVTQPRPLCDNAMVVIFISRDPQSIPNDAPVAVDDFATICADANATVNVLLNDNDPNGDAITSVTVIDGVNNGTTSNPGLGLYIYDPNTGFSGTDTMTYQICDNGTPSLCDTAIVVFTVNPTPVITPSVASLNNCSGDAVNITFNSNVGGTVFTWSGSNGTSGTGNISTTLTNTGTTNITVTYTVTGVAGGGCGSNTLTIPVTVRPRPVVTFSQNNTVFCSGEQVVINIFSTIPSTTFTWSGSNGSSGTGNIITNNPTNTGTIDSTVTYTINSSFNGCSGTPVTVNVTVKPRPTLSVTPPTQTVCSGTPITINITSSVPGSSVNWTGSNGNSGNTFVINDSPINLGASNITVTYTINGQFNGCAGATTTATVVVRPRVIADAGQDKNVTACSASCVSIGGSPTGNGGSGSLTYAWSPLAGLNDSTLANPTACNINTLTTYTVTVTDASGCSATDAMTITVTPSSLTAEAGAGGALCLGTGDSVMLGGFPTAVGGTPTYTYTWFPTAGLNLTNPANPEAFPASTTTYYLTVTDALGCTSVDSTVITVYPVLVANAGRDTAVCATFGAPLGGTPTANGGSGSGYTYTWSPTTGLDNINSSNPVATFATATVVTYAVVVLDGNGCSASDNVVVTVRPNPIAQAGSDKTITTCPGDSVILGDLPAVISGTAPFTYSWTPVTGIVTATNIANPVAKALGATTTYTLNITDANGCVSSDNVIVTVLPNTLQAQAGNDEEVCSNNNCVQIGGLPTAVGGNSPYTYAWSNSSSLSSGSASNPLACPTVIGATTYTVTITDSKGCTATDAATVTVNPTPTASAGPDTSVCFGSSILIGGSPSATGGTPGYTYSWTPTIGLSLPNIANPAASPAVVTTYQLIVTDSRGCSTLDEVTVTPRSTPVVDAGSDKSITQCPNDTAFIGNIPVVVSGGTAPYTYDWTPGTSLSDSTIENPFVVGLGSTTSYQILVTDIYGCQGIDYVIVNVTPSTLQVDAGNGGSLCAAAGTSIVIGGNPTAVGGTTPYLYAWASSVGGFSSNLPNPTVTPTGTTIYYVTVTDAKGCSQVDSVEVRINAAPAVSAGTDDTICSGFCVTLGGAPTGSAGTTPYQYSWTPTLGLNANNTPNPLACPLITTTYTVQLTDSNGCVATDAITITVRPNPVANAGVDQTLVNCGSDSVQIGGSPAASGGTPAYTYAWSPATGLVSATTVTNPWVKGLTASQLYTLVVTDVNGCTAEDAVLVNVVPSSLVADAGNGGTYCAGSGGSVTLGGSPTAGGGTSPFVFAWSGGLPATQNPVASPLTTTKYYVTVTDSKGCVSIDSATVTVNLSPTANAGVDTAICGGEDVTLGGAPSATGGTPGYTYSWTPGIGLSSTSASNPTATPVTTTTYVVVVTDANGCSATDNIAVTVRQNPIADAGADQNLQACSADSVQIGGSPTASGGGGNYTYSWTPALGLNFADSSNPYVRNIGSTSTYTLIVTDQFGCWASDQVAVVVDNPSLVAQAGNDVSFCQGASVSVTLGGSPTAVGGTSPYSYDWTPGEGLSDSTAVNPVATPLVTTTYNVAVRDANGCVAEDTVRITINPRPVVSAGVPDTICSGECIVLGGSPTADNGTPPYSYNWTPAFFFSTSTTIANPTVCPTNNVTYVVTATDSLGCSNTASVSVRVNQNPIANAGADKILVSCPDACVVIGGTPTATGGGGGYLYAWAPSAGLNNTGLANPSACNLSQDVTYNLTVTDANGCTAIDQVLVDVQQSTLAADAGNDRSICAGQPTCITIGGTNAVSGGSTPYIIEWSPISGICNSNVIPNPDVNPTDTTTYVLLVTDALGCVAIDSMVVFANPAVTASVTPDTSICQGGSALLGGNPTGSGGTSPYTYNWGPGTGLSSTTNSNPIATPLVTTAYCVTVTDFVGCSSSTCQNVNVNAGVRADAGQDQTITNCPGAFVTIGGSPSGFGGSGNYAYAWSPTTGLNGSTIPNPIVTNITITTTYTLTVTDNTTGCVGIDQVTVIVNPSSLDANAGPDRVFCANSAGCITIGGTTTGGVSPYIYQWSPITGLSSGTIQNPCAAPLITTTYYLTVTDQLGCNIVDSMRVIVSPMIAVNAGLDSSICLGTSIVLGANPPVVGGTTPYTYAWSGGAFPSNVARPTAAPTTNSSYTLTVTDSLGCSSSDIVNINVRQQPIADAGVDQTITSCSNDSAILGGSPTATGTVGPYTYLWSPITGLSGNTLSNPVVDSLGNAVIYTVTVTDAFGCQGTDQVQITATPPVINVEAGANVGSICSNTGGCVVLGGSPTVSGNGVQPYTYQWFGTGLISTDVSNPTACPTDTTTYIVVVTDANGCRASDTVQVIVNTPTEASISGLNSQYCVGSPNVVMTGIPAGGVFGGPFVTGNVFQPSSVGTWCVNYTYTNPATGCVDDTILCVTVNPLPVVDVTGYNANVCVADAPQTLVGTPAGGFFTGSPGLSGGNGETFTPANAIVGNNNITYTYTDEITGCVNTFSFVINVKGAPTITISGSDSACAGSTVVLTPTYSFDVFSIVWSVLGGGTIQNSLSPITVSPSGLDYCVIATAINTPNGCVARDTFCIHVNQAPIPVDDELNICEEETGTVDVVVNDSDPEGNSNNVTVISAPNGTTSVNNGVITYTGNADYNGVDLITYLLCNTNCPTACDTGVVLVNICPINDPPVIEDTTITIYEDDTADVCPTIYDVDGDPLVISDALCAPLNGTLTFTSDSCFQFIPTAGWNGTQVICVIVCDTAGLCDTGTITIVVLPTNNAPVTEDINVTVCDSTSIGINISASAGDPDGDPILFDYSPVTAPSGATFGFSKTGNGALVFQGDMPGTYTFEYYACDNSTIPVFSLCDTSLVTITVIDCDTVSGNLPPVANDDHVTTTPGVGTVINELANDFDPDGDPLTVTILNGPFIVGATAVVNPDGTITYTSPIVGLDSIVYQICDPSGLCDVAVIYINVTDSPNSNHPPVAVDDFETTDYLTPVVVEVLNNDHDPDGDSIHVTVIPCPASDGVGVVSGNGTTITYTPGPNANADNPDTLCYVICEVLDATSCDTANVVIYINNSVQGVADCGNNVTGRENPIDIDVTANDFDPEADSFWVVSVLPIAGTTHGTGSVNNDGTIHYVPANDTCDYIDTISYVIQDVRGATDTVNVCIYINCCTTPVAVTDLATIISNDVLVIDVQNNDSLFGVPATTTIVVNGAHGSASVNGSVVTYTPSNNYCGLDTVQYGISSSCGADTGLLIVTVSCNQNPVSVKDNLTMCSNDTATINVFANDTDPEGDSLFITALGNPFPANLGFVVAVDQGNVTFQSNGTAGTFSINYIVCDAGLPSKCDTNTVIVQVLNCIVPDIDTIYDTTCVVCPDTICIGDWVVGNNYPTISNLCDPQNGTVEILADSLCFVYTPDIDFIGNDTFCITVCDTLGDCDSAVVIITVLDPLIQAVDQPCDLDTTYLNTPITIAVLDNDILPSAADTTVTLLTLPINGTAVVNADNTVTYTPNAESVEDELFSYLVCATSGAFSYCDTATICITVVDTVVECFIPNGFSPNGDGVNDTYVIPCSDRNPEATVRIFNRWGVEVWYSEGPYKNDWSGNNMQGIVLPDGTYYVIYEYLDGTGRREAKFVVIHR